MQVLLRRFPQCDMPTSGFSMTFVNLHWLATLLDELRPHTIVEFGSGLSTLLTAAWLKEQGRGMLYSFEHDPTWGGLTGRNLDRHGLGSHCQLVVTPLAPFAFDGRSVPWYAIDEHLDALPPVDFLIVDGPPAAVDPAGRAPALFALKSRLASTYCVVLDDAHRPGERQVVELWRTQIPTAALHTVQSATGLAVLRVSSG